MSLNSIFYFDNSGRREEILSPELNLSSVSDPELTFDLAFNYVEYTPPYFTTTVDFSDTLEVLISTDCGKTFNSLYKKGGKDLATYTMPITNPLSLNAVYTVPGASNWRNEKISLTNYASHTDAVIKLSYISGLGGCIGIDNFSVAAKSVGIAPQQKVGLVSIYPNPASDIVNISVNHANLKSAKIYDISGKLIMNVDAHDAAGQTLSVNTSALAAGFYTIEVTTDQTVSTEKILIKR